MLQRVIQTQNRRVKLGSWLWICKGTERQSAFWEWVVIGNGQLEVWGKRILAGCLAERMPQQQCGGLIRRPMQVASRTQAEEQSWSSVKFQQETEVET